MLAHTRAVECLWSHPYKTFWVVPLHLTEAYRFPPIIQSINFHLTQLQYEAHHLKLAVPRGYVEDSTPLLC